MFNHFISILLIAIGFFLDYISTSWALTRGAVEANPVVRKFSLRQIKAVGTMVASLCTLALSENLAILAGLAVFAFYYFIALRNFNIGVHTTPAHTDKEDN
jgi:hypothetical protein